MRSRTVSVQASLLLLAALLAPLGCASGDGEPPVATPPTDPIGPCAAVVEGFAVDTATHVAECSSLPQPARPPSGGEHYPSWAAYQSYDFPIADGFLIHSMEHGAIVFYYRCDDGCPAEVDQVEDFIAALPEDPLCAGTGTPRRVVLVPDPRLGVRWAMSAWGFTLRANCFDEEVFQAFYDEHYGAGPESLCNPGVAFTTPPCQ